VTAVRIEPRYKRTEWFNPQLDNYEAGELGDEIMVPCVPEMPGLENVAPNLVSSRLTYGERYDSSYHSPVLDIDFPARLVPSTTEGHFHLYLDGITMEWKRYERLLAALAEAGIIEQGYYEASVRRKMTCVRLPHVRKPVENEAA
jgi:hypothetical protein